MKGDISVLLSLACHVVGLLLLLAGMEAPAMSFFGWSMGFSLWCILMNRGRK